MTEWWAEQAARAKHSKTWGVRESPATYIYIGRIGLEIPHSWNKCMITFNPKLCVRTFLRTFRHSSFFLIICICSWRFPQANHMNKITHKIYKQWALIISCTRNMHKNKDLHMCHESHIGFGRNILKNKSKNYLRSFVNGAHCILVERFV